MPDTIGVRELKNRTSHFLRVVREEMTEYIVTLRGEPVAAIYVALASQLEDCLITLDQQQLERAGAIVDIRKP